MAKSKENKSSARYKEDIIFFRMSALFLLVCIAVVGIFRLKAMPSNAFHRFAHTPWVMAAVTVLLLAAVGYWLYCKITKKDESLKSVSSINCVAVAAYIFLFTMYWGWTYSPRYGTVITLTIALPLLYFINHIYKKDFFAFSASNLIFAAAVWLFMRSGLIFTVAAAVMLPVSAFCCYYGYRLGKKYNGAEKYKYRFEPICISFLITVVLIVLRSFVKVQFLTSSLVWIIMLFQYIAGGIYYTIKLLREA